MTRIVNIFVGGKSDSDLAVLERLISWSAEGWLQPFVWVGPDDAHEGGLWAAHSITAGEHSGGLLADALVERDLAGFRVIVVALLISGTPASDATRTGQDIADLIEQRRSPQQFLKRVSILIPTGLTEVIPEELLLRDWDVNVVFAPEDRHVPLAADGGVHLGRNYVEHAAMAVATAAGLWVACDSAPFDDSSLFEHVPAPRIELARGFVRVIVGAQLVDALMTRLLADPFGSSIKIHTAADLTRVRDDTSLVDDALAQLVANAGGGALKTGLLERPAASSREKKHVLLAWVDLFPGIAREVPKVIRRKFWEAPSDKVMQWFANVTQEQALGGARSAKVAVIGDTVAKVASVGDAGESEPG